MTITELARGMNEQVLKTSGADVLSSMLGPTGPWVAL